MNPPLDDIVKIIRENREAELRELRRTATELFRKVEATLPRETTCAMEDNA